MRIVIAAVVVAVFGMISPPLVDSQGGRLNAQVLSTKPGNAPADALFRTLHQRKHAKRAKASQGGARARTKNMFQLRKSPFEQKFGSEKAKKNIIRRMQK